MPRFLLPLFLVCLCVSLRAAPPTPGTIAPPSYQLLELDLGGSQRTDRWLAMTQFNYIQSYYGYGGHALVAVPWQYAMAPNYPSADSSALLNKGTLLNTNGTLRHANGYPALEGIYTLFTRTPFILTESFPLPGLKTVSFQIYLTTGGSDDMEIYGVDGDLHVLPTLNLTTSEGPVSLAPAHAELYKSIPYTFDHSGGGVEEEIDLYENYRQFTWDLGSVAGTITGFEITFATYEHVSMRSIQLDQSDVALAPVLSALETWRHTHFGSAENTGDGADVADPDGDGLPNLLEYALGRHPLAPEAGQGITLGFDATGLRLTITFQRIADPALRYAVEAGDDLSATVWPEIWNTDELPPPAGTVTETVEDTQTLSASPRRFLRLRVEPR